MLYLSNNGEVEKAFKQLSGIYDKEESEIKKVMADYFNVEPKNLLIELSLRSLPTNEFELARVIKYVYTQIDEQEYAEIDDFLKLVAYNNAL